MHGIYARRIIALVTNLKSAWYRAVVNLPRKTMRALRLGPFAAVRSYANYSVPPVVERACPRPAAIRFNSLVPKTNEKRSGFIGPITMFVTELLGLAAFGVSAMAFQAFKGIAAVWAYKVYNFCYTMTSSHDMTSETGCAWSGPFENYNSLAGRLHCNTGGGPCAV